ncbi:MAG: hypothetical protein ABR568_05130 [Pyrinomonadaceae bacterium]
MTTLFIFGITFGAASFVAAQEVPSAIPTEEQQQQEKAEKEKKAYILLDQVVDEAQMLRLPENRVRVQIGGADLLWDHNEGRARTLFALAAEGVAEMMRNATTNPGQDERRGANRGRPGNQLRQELVLAVARHDATLAYQLLATTRPPTTPAGTGNSRVDSEDNLEDRLLAQVAELDPKLALQNAELMLDKGQYSRSLAQVLARLQAKDKDAAAKLEDKLVKRLQSTNILSTPDAGTLALSLLRPGPRPAESRTTPAPASTGNNPQTLAASAYASLLGNLIDAALKATPAPAGSQRNANNFRGRRGGPGGGGGGQINPATEPSAAELEQSNARRLLGGLLMMLPQIDQYLPGRSQAVRQKMTELGIVDNSRLSMTQVARDMQQGTSESLLTSASSAPPAIQNRIYQQAAMRALDEGNSDRARQIANDHLEPVTRQSVLQAVEFRQTSEKMDSTKIAEVRQTLAGLRSDDERIDLLVQLSGNARQNNPKLAVELLNEARQFTNRRATNYRQFEQQLRVAEAFKDLEPARSFEILEPGIVQLNELLAAAATLSGFEVNVFQEGELPLEGRNGLSNMVTRYGHVLGLLATNDFDQSQTLANRFQLSESRIVARLSIVRSMLGKETGLRQRGSRFGQNTTIRRGLQ